MAKARCHASKRTMAERLILLNKPFNVLCQFTDETGKKQTLGDYIPIKDVYALPARL